MSSELVTGLGIGLALAGAPGPVQAVLLGEAVWGGVGRGLRALVGASLTFGLLLICVALGVSVVIPDGPVLSALSVAGGGLLIWLAWEAFRSGASSAPTPRSGRSLPAALRGSLAILLNPGAWLFLGAVASPLIGRAFQEAGSPGALSTAIALMLGAALGDVGVVLIGATALRRAGRAFAWIQRGLGAILAGTGTWMILSALAP